MAFMLFAKKYFFDGEQDKETVKNWQFFLKNEKMVLKYEKSLKIKGFGGNLSTQLQWEFSNMRIEGGEIFCKCAEINREKRKNEQK